MAIPLNVNGSGFSFPEKGDVGYATQVTAWAKALTNGVLQSGGSVAFSFLVSATANPATTGAVRLAKTDAVKFRNNANNADLAGLALNAQDNLTANGTQLDGQPGLRATMTVSQTGLTALANVKFNNTVQDTDSAYSAATGNFTVPTGKGGWYHVDVSLVTQQVTSAGQQTIYINQNGTRAAGIQTNGTVAAASFLTLAASTKFFCAAGDTIAVQLSTSAGTVSAVADTATSIGIKRLV